MMMVAGEKLPTDSNVKAAAGAVRCPRCDSGNTKFCYYNNYSLSQPRHFCRACKRYWTRGGALRNVPVGGRCHRRKNKRTAAAATKKSPFLPLPSSPSSRLPPLRHQDPNNSSVFAGPHTLDAPSLPFIDAGGGFNLPPLPPSAANLADGACLPPSSLLFCGMKEASPRRKHAYAAMMYMGTPRDYEFYVATRVMMRSLARLGVDADLVVIASVDVPVRWVQTLQEEDGVKVVSVENLKNPYENQGNFNSRFKLTLNKLYAWSLVSYDRVVMLDSDNIFLQRTDELFMCGQFCAVFINPCIFHTGLFVLQPSMKVFNNMLHELEIGRDNPDGADQGFLASYFSDLLDQPMFHPPSSGAKLNGSYRLPLGYQMDASYYYLKLRWSIPCGPNSVITFPSAPWLKPWYWWSWPVLPLGLSWHELRRENLGYGSDLPILLIQAVMYVGIIAITRLARPSLSKLCYNRRQEKSIAILHTTLKIAAFWSMIAAYSVPFFLIPRTVHPIFGWSLYMLGVASLSSIVINVFLLPPLPVLTVLLGMLGSLFVMAFPWYPDGVIRALTVFAYAFCYSPIAWASLLKVTGSLQNLVEREVFFPRLGESTEMSEFNKLY